MALRKEIKQEDGVVTAYHRILSIDSMINKMVSIIVLSYVDESSRQTENDGVRPYRVGITYQKDYEENMTVESAYSYLKSLDVFKNAEDVLEEENQNGN